MTERNLDPMTLHALIDGELPPEEHAAALATANSDANSGLLYTEYSRLKEAVRTLPAVDIPHDGWKRCVRRIDEIDRSRKAERFVTKYAWAMSLSVFLLIVGAGSWNRLTGQHMGAGDVSHMASMLSPLVRTENPQSGQVGKWLQESRVGRVDLKNLAVVRTLRAEYGDVDGKRTVRLTLQDGSGLMALYIWPGSETVDGFQPINGGPLSLGQVNGQNCIAWNQDSCHLVLVGPRDEADLERIATGLSNGAGSISNGN